MRTKKKMQIISWRPLVGSVISKKYRSLVISLQVERKHPRGSLGSARFGGPLVDELRKQCHISRQSVSLSNSNNHKNSEKLKAKKRMPIAIFKFALYFRDHRRNSMVIIWMRLGVVFSSPSSLS